MLYLVRTAGSDIKAACMNSTCSNPMEPAFKNAAKRINAFCIVFFIPSKTPSIKKTSKGPRIKSTSPVSQKGFSIFGRIDLRPSASAPPLGSEGFYWFIGFLAVKEKTASTPTQ